MPRHDGKGPEGHGPRTGWGYGPCERAENPPHIELTKKLDEVLDRLRKIENELRR
jgi:hypothetical protein